MWPNTLTLSCSRTLRNIKKFDAIFRNQDAKRLYSCSHWVKHDQKDSTFSNQKIRQFSTTNVSKIWTTWKSTAPSSIPADTLSSGEVSTTPVDQIATITSTPVDNVATAVSVDPGVTEAISGVIVDPPFVELGLASSWWPNHLVHQMLEFVHLSTDLSWWSTIIIGTIVIRVVSFPLYIYTRKFTIRLNNNSEELEKHKAEIEKYKMQDDEMKVQMANMKLLQFQKQTGTGAIRGIVSNSSMSVLFITCVTAVRQMCNVPVPSLTEGGALWFMDLSSSDPYYILPLVTGAVITLTINTGMKMGTIQEGTWSGAIRKLQYLPIVLMPLLFGRMSSGIYLYWVTTSVITLAVQRTLLIPGVQEKLKFPILKEKKPTDGTLMEMFRERKKTASDKSMSKLQVKRIKQARKQREKDRKKELKGKPPVTFEIGVDAMPTKKEIPDFEREWRPARPKHFGTY